MDNASVKNSESQIDLLHLISNETALILGIPVDNITFVESIDNIFKLIEKYKSDHIPKYVATVNVDFIVNTLSWIPGRTSHPELLEILRK